MFTSNYKNSFILKRSEMFHVFSGYCTFCTNINRYQLFLWQSFTNQITNLLANGTGSVVAHLDDPENYGFETNIRDFRLFYSFHSSPHIDGDWVWI